MVRVAHCELKAIVGKHSFDADTPPLQAGDNLLEEGHRMPTKRTVNDLHEPEAAEGADSRYLEERPAATNAGQLLEVDPDLGAGVVVDDTLHRLSGFNVQVLPAETAEHTVHCGPGNAQGNGNTSGTDALSLPVGEDRYLNLPGQPPRGRVGATGPVPQTFFSQALVVLPVR